MRIHKDIIESLYKDVRVSIREVTIFNPFDFRPNSEYPLSFKVKYQVIGKQPQGDGAKFGRNMIIKEATEIMNISFLMLEDDDQDALFDMTYGLKRLFEKRISEHEGVKSDHEEESRDKAEAKSSEG